MKFLIKTEAQIKGKYIYNEVFKAARATARSEQMTATIDGVETSLKEVVREVDGIKAVQSIGYDDVRSFQSAYNERFGRNIKVDNDWGPTTRLAMEIYVAAGVQERDQLATEVETSEANENGILVGKHVVKSGDTLSEILLSFDGIGTSEKNLILQDLRKEDQRRFEASQSNADQIKQNNNVDLIRPGETITVRKQADANIYFVTINRLNSPAALSYTVGEVSRGPGLGQRPTDIASALGGRPTRL